MPHAEPILVRNENDRPHHWRRFLAALCFMEFYVTFVYAGLAIWDDDPGLSLGAWAEVLQIPWSRIPLLVGAAMLYLCGRGLWRSRRSEKTWLWLGIVIVFLMIVCEVVAAAMWSSRGNPYFAVRSATPIGTAILAGIRSGSVHYVLLAVLGVGVWITRPNNRLLRTTTAPWVYCAAAYCLMSIPGGLLGQDNVAQMIGWAMFQRTSISSFFLLAGFISVALLIATAAALLCRSPLARTGALILAAANIVVVWHIWYPISMLVRIAIRAMMMSLPLSAEIDEGAVWTQHDFLGLFVNPVRLVGPWLLIAIYAWKAPMRMPPDDGTPFPRRFCGKCYYNLHGIEANRCPECGTEFQSSGVKELGVSECA